MHQKIAKVPVIMQMEALECGAACLTMILAYFGKWVPLEQIRKDCGVSRDGSNAANILIAARSYGLQAGGYRYDVEELKKVQTPLIIFWGFSHFVVFCGFKKSGKAVICDPARGRIEEEPEVFNKYYTGIALACQPTEEFEKGGKQKSILEFARNRLKGTLVPIIFVSITSFILVVVGLINPALSRVFLDEILTGNNPGWLEPIILFMLGLVLVQTIVSILNAVYLLKIRGKLAVTSSAKFFWHILRLPMEFFSQRTPGDIASRQKSNETIAEILIGQVAPVFLNIILIVFYLIVLINYSVFLSLVGIFSVLINVFVAKQVSTKRVNTTRLITRNKALLENSTYECIEAIESIKASGSEAGYYEKWSGLQALGNTGNIRLIKINNVLGVIPQMVQQLTSAIVLVLGVVLIQNGEFTVGMLLAFQGFLASFMNPVNNMIGMAQTIQEMRTDMERVEDVMQYPPDIEITTELDDSISYAKLSGEVDMVNVSFGYARLAPPIITDFNLHLKPGDRVAFVGSSGCGKSTISKLISGLYEPWSGQILFDKKPKSEINRDVFTASVAVVDQDVILFEDTVSDNIRMWDNTIDKTSVIQAARDAGIHEDIILRKGGYDYHITGGGRDLSGGQRQRIEIARVLADNPSIIILDEATSALDALTEYHVANAIKERGITCIIVAHRLSTIRDCDEIIVLDKGKVVERGRHEELMSLDGYYKRLITME